MFGKITNLSKNIASIPDGQTPIIELGKKLGYNCNSKGVCFGTCLLFMQATLLGEKGLKSFYERYMKLIALINNTEIHYGELINQYNDLVNSSSGKEKLSMIKLKLSKKESLTKEERNNLNLTEFFLDIRGFYDALQLYQSPSQDYESEYFDPIIKKTKQRNINQQILLTLSTEFDKLLKSGGRIEMLNDSKLKIITILENKIHLEQKELKEMPFISEYTEEELSIYFDSLKIAIENTQFTQPLNLSLRGSIHQISASFVDNQCIFIDPNNVGDHLIENKENFTKNVSEALSFKEENLVKFSTDVYTICTEQQKNNSLLLLITEWNKEFIVRRALYREQRVGENVLKSLKENPYKQEIMDGLVLLKDIWKTLQLEKNETIYEHAVNILIQCGKRAPLISKLWIKYLLILNETNNLDEINLDFLRMISTNNFDLKTNNSIFAVINNAPLRTSEEIIELYVLLIKNAEHAHYINDIIELLINNPPASLVVPPQIICTMDTIKFLINSGIHVAGIYYTLCEMETQGLGKNDIEVNASKFRSLTHHIINILNTVSKIDKSFFTDNELFSLLIKNIAYIDVVDKVLSKTTQDDINQQNVKILIQNIQLAKATLNKVENLSIPEFNKILKYENEKICEQKPKQPINLSLFETTLKPSEQENILDINNFTKKK